MLTGKIIQLSSFVFLLNRLRANSTDRRVIRPRVVKPQDQECGIAQNLRKSPLPGDTDMDAHDQTGQHYRNRDETLRELPDQINSALTGKRQLVQRSAFDWRQIRHLFKLSANQDLVLS